MRGPSAEPGAGGADAAFVGREGRGVAGGLDGHFEKYSL